MAPQACRLGRFVDAALHDCRQMDGGANGYNWEYSEGSPDGFLVIRLPGWEEELSEFRYQTRYQKRKMMWNPKNCFLIGRRLPFLGEIRR